MILVFEEGFIFVFISMPLDLDVEFRLRGKTAGVALGKFKIAEAEKIRWSRAGHEGSVARIN